MKHKSVGIFVISVLTLAGLAHADASNDEYLVASFASRLDEKVNPGQKKQVESNFKVRLSDSLKAKLEEIESLPNGNIQPKYELFCEINRADVFNQFLMFSLRKDPDNNNAFAIIVAASDKATTEITLHRTAILNLSDINSTLYAIKKAANDRTGSAAGRTAEIVVAVTSSDNAPDAEFPEILPNTDFSKYPNPNDIPVGQVFCGVNPLSGSNFPL